MWFTETGPPPRLELRQLALVVAVLSGLGLLFFPGLLKGWVIASTDVLFFYPPWDVLRPEGLEAPSNRMLADQTREFLVFFHLARESLARGELPLWNPYIYCGTPLLANMQSALLYPLNVVHYLAPAWGFSFASLAKVAVGGSGLFVLARLLAMSPAASLLGGVVFALAGFNLFWLNHPQTNVTALFPWVLAVTHWLALRPGARPVGLLGVAVALQLLGGHVEIAFLVALAAGIWFAWTVVATVGWRQLLPRGAGLAAAYLLGLGLTALVVLPFVEFLANSATWHVRHAGNIFVLPWVELLSLIHPELLDVEHFGGMAVMFHSLGLYTGPLTLLLAGIALASGSPGLAPFRWIPLVLTIAVFGLMMAFGVEPLFSVLTSLPLLRETPAFYFVTFAVLALALLAARGTDAFLGGRIRLHRHVAVWTVILVIGLALTRSDTLMAHLAGAAGAVQPVPDFGARLSRALLLWCALAAGLAVLGWLHPRRRGGRLLATLLLLAGAAGPAWMFQRDWNPVIPAEWVLPEPPAVLQTLSAREGVFRVAGIAPTLRTNTAALVGLQDVRGYDVPVVDRFHRFFVQALGGYTEFWRYGLRTHDAQRLKLLGLLNVRYIMSRRPLDGELRTDPGQDGVFVNTNLRSLERAWFVPRATVVAGPDEALDRVMAADFEPLAEVVLETPAYAPEPAGSATGTVHVEHYSPHRVELAVEASGDGFVVLADTWYPGWRARVDGVDTDVLRGNYLLRAVPVAAGRHRVHFEYRPLSLRLGLILSIGSLLLTLWLLRRRAKSPS